MKKKMELDQFAELSAAVIRSLPREMESSVAQGWIQNQSALAKVLCEALVPLRALKIDRTKPFNPAKFIGKGWGIEEQDKRSLVLSEVNLADIRLVTMLKDGETRVQGEEKLLRLKKSGHIRLDAKVFQALWENKSLIPESWKGKCVYFDGTILRHPHGDRCVLGLDWHGGGWGWFCRWLGDDWSASHPSAVLAE